MTAENGPSIVYWLRDSLYSNITNRCTNPHFRIRNFMKGVGGFNLKLRGDPTAKEMISELQELMNKKKWKESSVSQIAYLQ